MLLEEVFARLEHKAKPEPADSDGAVMLQRLHELLNVPTPRPLPLSPIPSAPRLYRVFIQRWMNAFWK